MSIVRVSDKERRNLAQLRASVWHGVLNEQQFADRNEILYRHSYGKKIETFALKEDSITCSSLDLLPVQFTNFGAGYLIASVICDPKYRNRGYTTKVLEEVLKDKGDCPFILYSDIDPKFYSRFGFVDFPVGINEKKSIQDSLDIQESHAQDFLESVLALRKFFLKRVSHFLTAEYLDWILERYRYFHQIAGKKFPATFFRLHSNHPLFAIPHPIKNQLDVLWFNQECKKCEESLPALAAQMGLAQCCYWSAASSSTKQEHPMIRIPANPPLTDIQWVDWW